MLCDDLKALREKRKMTNQQISDASGVPLSSVNRVFSGQTDNPGFLMIRDIVVAMKGSLDEIAGIKHQSTADDQIIKLYERTIAEKDLWLKRLFIFSVSVVAVLLIFLLIDIISPSTGYIRY
jgi:transcriptional regulator with XRE-family HTH domain